MSFISPDRQLLAHIACTAPSTGIPSRDLAVAQVRPDNNSPEAIAPTACDDRYSPDNNTRTGQATAQDGYTGGCNRSTTPNTGLVKGSVRSSENHRRRCAPDPDDPHTEASVPAETPWFLLAIGTRVQPAPAA